MPSVKAALNHIVKKPTKRQQIKAEKIDRQIDNAVGTAKDAGKQIIKGIKNVAGNLKNVNVSQIPEKIKNFANDIKNTDTSRKIDVNQAKTNLAGLKDKATNFLGNLHPIQKVKDSAGNAMNSEVAQKAAEKLQQAKSVAENKFSEIKDKVSPKVKTTESKRALNEDDIADLPKDLQADHKAIDEKNRSASTSPKPEPASKPPETPAPAATLDQVSSPAPENTKKSKIFSSVQREFDSVRGTLRRCIHRGNVIKCSHYERKI